MYKRVKVKIDMQKVAFHTSLLLLFIASILILNASHPILAPLVTIPQLVPAWSYTPEGKIISQPVVSKGMIYLANLQKLEAVNTTSGKKQWDFTSKDGDLARPTPSAGIVYTYSNASAHSAGKIYAIDAHSGADKWHFVTNVSPCGLSPVVNGVIYVVSNQGASSKAVLYALDAISGKVRWSYETEGNYCLSLNAVNGVVYTNVEDDSSTNSTLVAVDASSGTRLWSHGLTASLEYAPIIANGMLYIVLTYDEGNLMILDALSTKTGVRQWSYTAEGGLTEPVVAKGMIYIGASEPDLLNGNGTLSLYALDATSGNKLWSYQAGTHIDQKNSFSSILAYGAFTPLALINGVVYADMSLPTPKGDVTLYALNAASGKTLWSSHLGVVDGISSSLVVANGILYVGTISRGKLYALDPGSGVQLLTYLMTDSPEFAPIVVNNSVFSTSNSTLYALNIRTREVSPSPSKTTVFLPARTSQAVSSLSQAPSFADVSGLHIQSGDGMQCPSTLVLASDRVTYSKEELNQIRRYLEKDEGPLPPTLRWVSGLNTCTFALQISNVGNEPLQIRSIGVKLADTPRSNAALHLRTFNECSVDKSLCGGRGSGGGGCSLISVDIVLKAITTPAASFTAPLTGGEESCFEPTLYPNDTIDVVINFTSSGSASGGTAPYTYSLLPVITSADSKGPHTFPLTSMVVTAPFLSEQQFSCDYLQNDTFVLKKASSINC